MLLLGFNRVGRWEMGDWEMGDGRWEMGRKRLFIHTLSSLPRSPLPLNQSSQCIQQQLLVKITFSEIGISTCLQTAIAIGCL